MQDVMNRKMSKTREASMVDIAWALAHKAHSGQAYERKNCNWEYITHVKRVVHNLGDVPLEVEVTGILHDVCEDSDVAIHEIYNIFGTKVGDAIFAISRRSTEDYNDYIIRCSKNHIARQVKAVDIADHILHCVKPDRPGDWDTLLVKYLNAMDRLHFPPK